MSPEPRRWRKRRSVKESEDEARRMASQQGSPEGVEERGFGAEEREKTWWAEEEEAVQVVSEPELVERWMSAVLVVVLVVVAELKLML